MRDTEGGGVVRRKVIAATLDDAGPLVAGRRVKETRMITPGPKGELASVVREPIAVPTPEVIRARAELEEVVDEGVAARGLGGLDIEVTTWGLGSVDEILVPGGLGEDAETTREIDALVPTATVIEEIEDPRLGGVAMAGVGAGVDRDVVTGVETGCEVLDIELNLPGDEEEIVKGSKVVLEYAWEVLLLGVNGGEELASLVVIVETEKPAMVDVGTEQSERVTPEPQLHSCTTEQPHSPVEFEQTGARGLESQPAAYGSGGHSQGT